MKNSILILCVIICLVSYVESSRNYSRNDYNFFPNLPAGEYRLYLKAIYYCNLSRDVDIQPNFYLNRKSQDVTELRGNLTLKIPLDDSFTFQVNMAIKDSIGGWKDNAFLYKSPNVCSSIKYFLGTGWSRLIKSFGHTNISCPIPPGVYILRGYDLKNLTEDFNFPKTFFYGTYKMRIFFTDRSNNYKACIIYVIDVKRRWEIE